MFLFFIYFSFSYLLEVPNNLTFSQLIFLASKRPVFATFYSEDCKYSRHFLPKFSKASKFFPYVYFIKINCDKNEQLCNKLSVVGTPTTILYKDKNFSKSIDFTYPRTKSSIIEFVERFTGNPSINYSKQSVILNQFNIDTMISNEKCSVIFYGIPNNKAYHTFWKNFKAVFSSFRNEDIEFGSVNCNIYYCNNYTRYLPAIKIYKNNSLLSEIISYDKKDLFNAINSNCGFHRQLNGLLQDDYVLNKTIKQQINETFPNYFLNQNNETFISPFKDTPYEKFYDKIVNDLRRSNDKIKDIQELIDTLDYYIIYKQTSLIVIDELYTKRLILDYIRANFIDSEQFNS